MSVQVRLAILPFMHSNLIFSRRVFFSLQTTLKLFAYLCFLKFQPFINPFFSLFLNQTVMNISFLHHPFLSSPIFVFLLALNCLNVFALKVFFSSLMICILIALGAFSDA